MRTVLRAAALAVAAVYLRRSCLAVLTAFRVGVSTGKFAQRRRCRSCRPAAAQGTRDG